MFARFATGEIASSLACPKCVDSDSTSVSSACGSSISRAVRQRSAYGTSATCRSSLNSRSEVVERGASMQIAGNDLRGDGVDLDRIHWSGAIAFIVLNMATLGALFLVPVNGAIAI